jgi:hypothetical protein
VQRILQRIPRQAVTVPSLKIANRAHWRSWRPSTDDLRGDLQAIFGDVGDESWRRSREEKRYQDMLRAAQAGQVDVVTEMWLKSPYMAPAMEYPALAPRLRQLTVDNYRTLKKIVGTALAFVVAGSKPPMGFECIAYEIGHSGHLIEERKSRGPAAKQLCPCLSLLRRLRHPASYPEENCDEYHFQSCRGTERVAARKAAWRSSLNKHFR